MPIAVALLDFRRDATRGPEIQGLSSTETLFEGLEFNWLISRRDIQPVSSI
jgi:hypothetical protein